MSRQPTWMTWTRRGLVALGLIALLYAGVGVLTEEDNLFNYIRFLILSLVGHELVLMPIFIGVGVLVVKLVPRTARPIVQAALLTTAAVVIIALPAVTGHGRSSDLPSALPRDYPRGLLIVVGCIWATAMAVLLIRAIRRGRRPVEEG
ncbi:hypothetical protein Rhe02_32900 [Rhizocola hellebori]|uniref:Uncharacterized protein n=1 Tax=Rhizocola hellebori TaxID=1392758 RepID=A0A8J3Q6Z9_9ACTN|nr:hypothetical protein [Rhizocola hellebori]GIH05223.1 hypothetical protein Rhe02_32900 [Rhizocola hellebori]